MAENALEIIECELTRCMEELLSFYDRQPGGPIDVKEADLPGPLEEPLVCSSIGLTGEEFKLSVVILAASETIARFSPHNCISTTDWIGELANQLMGRLKNALIEYGHEGQLSLPVTLSGSSIQLWNETEFPKSFIIQTGGGRIVLRLEADVRTTSPWVRAEESGAAAEGTMCLF